MSDIPRVPFEELPPSLVAHLKSKVERLGYLGEFFQVGANLPDVLEHFVEFTEWSKSHVPQRLVEVVALTVASQVGNAYERNQHEHLCAHLGYSGGWILSVESGRPELLDDPHERTTQTYVLAALERHGIGAGRAFDALVDALGHEVALGIAFVTARYVAHALLVNTLDLAPPVPRADVIRAVGGIGP